MGNHYRFLLNDDANGSKEVLAFVLLHSPVRLIVVHGLLARSVRHTRSAAAAREHVNNVSHTAPGRPDGMPKGIPICSGCAVTPDRPATALPHKEPVLEAQGIPLAALTGSYT